MVAALRVALSGLSGDFRESEIENLRLTSIGDEDVRGLDVAMNDTFSVSRIESVGDLDTQL